MKDFNFDQLVELEDISIGNHAQSSHQLSDAVDLLFWFNERKQHLPYSILVDKGLVSPEFKEHDAFQMLSSSAKSGSAALFKSGNLKESQKRETIVAVWQAVVSARAKKIDAPEFNIDDIDLDFLKYIASLSVNIDNIKEVESILLSKGIIFIVEPSFPGLGKDGCVYKNNKGNPVLALSLRHDRLDNFWFTLLHEISHIILHYESLDKVIIEDVESKESDEIEDEANYFTKECIVDRVTWKKFALPKNKSEAKLYELSELSERHPALIAGRVRFETGDWSLFSDIVHDISPKEVLGL
ncbi:ImmA/IrrE family metallo-endopeptidase [Vibrio vulnificus]|nr:ImmA/IrrE family metallo-endopeptidase [Vibrio vulnificus]EIA1336687.1 ImmA/IrrE family metallo-endopeptidase [Vibrio vulnificus]EIU7594675.1 ImmA/IrrE family metallo-endopeptidase [Vibrio vulnificus]EIX4869581.1 ImmA/IrrE family metallo-endopeptidase [Vibrio vulnificus]EJE8687515.1 ImmA/IrrE family metallo-endopeptidase [Vibrio vulnificus]